MEANAVSADHILQIFLAVGLKKFYFFLSNLFSEKVVVPHFEFDIVYFLFIH